MKKYLLSLKTPEAVSAMKKYLPLLKTPEAVSVMIHLVFFLLLALIVIKPQELIQWHSFEWQSELPEEKAPGAYAMQPGKQSSPRRETIPQTPVKQKSPSPEVRSETSPAQTPVQSDLIDPVHNPETQPTRPTLPQVRPGIHRPGTVQSEGRSGGDGEFGDILDSDDIEVVHRVKPTVEVQEFGSVTLNFRLRSTGTVDPFSIIVLGFDRGVYGTASEDALKKWRFRFKGRINSSRVYQITFKFIPQ